MSEDFAAMAAQGAHRLVEEAEHIFLQAVAQQGAEAPISYPNTVYYLPVILSNSAKAIEMVGDLEPVIRQARALLASGAAFNPGQAALLAAEIIEALKSPEGQFDSRISDTQVRAWGVQMADGRQPGLALIIGCARNNTVAIKLVESLRLYNILCLFSGSSKAGSAWDQIQDVALEPGNRDYVVPLGKEPTSAAHALGFAARCAMRLGGYKPGMWSEILGYCKRHVPGFVIALGKLEERDYAMGLAAAEFGFPFIMDTAGATGDAKQVIAVPFESLPGQDDSEKAAQLVEKCMAVRKLKPKTYEVGVPVSYGPAFGEEAIPDTDTYVEFGGQGSSAFELLQKGEFGDLTDGEIEVIGPALPDRTPQTGLDLGIVVKVAGEKIESDFEPYLERQIDTYINYASGVQHTGRQDGITVRLSKAAVAKGFRLESLGRIIHTRLHEDFGTTVQKVEVTLITDPNCFAEWLQTARSAYAERKQRAASLTDDQVDVFYVCTHCRTFAPNNVSIISPERVSPCGECNWFDARASFALNPAGSRRPIKPGKVIDAQKGIWEGTNKYARTASHGRMKEVALHSIMQTPMGACGDFECMVVLIPEANGVMVLAHEDTSRATPAGMTIETFSSLTAGEQIPGVVGIGKSYLLSPRFISPEGGFKRVVWMSSRLKQSMAKDLEAVCEREGEPKLMDMIADERHVTTLEELLRWLKDRRHPTLEMEKMF